MNHEKEGCGGLRMQREQPPSRGMHRTFERWQASQATLFRCDIALASGLTLSRLVFESGFPSHHSELSQ